MLRSRSQTPPKEIRKPLVKEYSCQPEESTHRGPRRKYPEPTRREPRCAYACNAIHAFRFRAWGVPSSVSAHLLGNCRYALGEPGIPGEFVCGTAAELPVARSKMNVLLDSTAK